jgi:hypothetical protein
VEAYPSMRCAARMVGITTGALSRRRDVERLCAGNEKRIPAAEVVRLAATYRRRPPSRVAAELVEHAIGVDPALEDIVGREVDTALERFGSAERSTDVAAFVSQADRLLPPPLAVQVRAILENDAPVGTSGAGWSPAGD